MLLLKFCISQKNCRAYISKISSNCEKQIMMILKKAISNPKQRKGKLKLSCSKEKYLHCYIK